MEIFVKRDKYNSIISITSSIYPIQGIEEKIDEWVEGQDRYLYAHADNGEYVKQKYGKQLYDENGRPNFHGNFIAWTDEEKQKKYPLDEPQPSELDLLKERQDRTEEALQDLIIATISM